MRTASLQVGSLLIQGFPRLRTGSGCRCPPGPRSGVAVRAQAEAGPSQAAVPTGIRTRDPRASRQARTRAPPHKSLSREAAAQGERLVPGYRSQDPTSAGCAAAPPPASPPAGAFDFFLFRNYRYKVVGACVSGLAEVCRCPSSASSQLALRCSLSGSSLPFQGRCFNSLLTFPASICPAVTREDESDHV